LLTPNAQQHTMTPHNLQEYDITAPHLNPAYLKHTRVLTSEDLQRKHGKHG
jgi:hypothetical protein